MKDILPIVLDNFIAPYGALWWTSRAFKKMPHSILRISFKNMDNIDFQNQIASGTILKAKNGLICETKFPLLSCSSSHADGSISNAPY